MKSNATWLSRLQFSRQLQRFLRPLLIRSAFRASACAFVCGHCLLASILIFVSLYAPASPFSFQRFIFQLPCCRRRFYQERHKRATEQTLLLQRMECTDRELINIASGVQSASSLLIFAYWEIMRLVRTRTTMSALSNFRLSWFLCVRMKFNPVHGLASNGIGRACCAASH